MLVIGLRTDSFSLTSLISLKVRVLFGCACNGIVKMAVAGDGQGAESEASTNPKLGEGENTACSFRFTRARRSVANELVDSRIRSIAVTLSRV